MSDYLKSEIFHVNDIIIIIILGGGGVIDSQNFFFSLMIFFKRKILWHKYIIVLSKIRAIDI